MKLVALLFCVSLIFMCVIFHLISQMPAHVRRMFESPLKLAHDLVEVHNYQQRHRTLVQTRVVKYFDIVISAISLSK